jgi:hypothetical protein
MVGFRAVAEATGRLRALLILFVRTVPPIARVKEHRLARANDPVLLDHRAGAQTILVASHVDAATNAKTIRPNDRLNVVALNNRLERTVSPDDKRSGLRKVSRQVRREVFIAFQQDRVAGTAASDEDRLALNTDEVIAGRR